MLTRYEDEDICIDGSYGTAKRGGTKLQAALDIKAGMRMEKFEEKFPAMLLMNRPRIEMAMAHANGARTTEPKIVILTGLTGTGKTQYCVNEYANEYWVNPSKSGSGIWWGSYYGQKVVVMDEFTDSWFQLKFLLRLWQQAPMAVEPKGGQVPFNSELIVVTSNVDPVDWYKNYKGNPLHKDAFQRRIRDFAEIYDCTVIDHCMGYKVYLRTKRTALFVCAPADSFESAGVGDLPYGTYGNGFSN